MKLIPNFLRPADTAKYLGISRRQVYNLAENDPSFPRKVILSSRCVGFLKTEIDSWLINKAQGAA